MKKFTIAVIIILSIILIPTILGIIINKLFNIHYVDGKYVTIGIFILICSIIAIFKTEKFAKNTSNYIEMKMIKYFGIIMLPLSIFVITNSLEKLELEKIYCENLKFIGRGVNSAHTTYSCNGNQYMSLIGNIKTGCSYSLYTKVNTDMIYEYELIKCK